GAAEAETLEFLADRRDRLPAARVPAAAEGEHDRGKPLFLGQKEVEFLLVTALGVRDVLLHRGQDGFPGRRLGVLTRYPPRAGEQQHPGEAEMLQDTIGRKHPHAVLPVRLCIIPAPQSDQVARSEMTRKPAMLSWPHITPGFQPCVCG